jgi:hypothetical protein
MAVIRDQRKFRTFPFSIFSGAWQGLVPDRHSFRQALEGTLYDFGFSKTPRPRKI